MKVLSISGGSTKIPYLYGISRELMVKNDYDAIVGVSSGAILALSMCAANHEEIKKNVLSFTIDDIFKRDPSSFTGKAEAGFNFVCGENYLLNSDPLTNTLKRVVSKEEFDNWKINGEKKAYVCAVCIETGSIHLVDLKTVDYEEAIKWVIASASIPVFTKPVVINGFSYSDGGLREHNAVGSYIKKHYRSDLQIDTVFSRPEDLNGVVETPKNVIEMAERSFEIMSFELSKNDEQVSEAYKELEINHYFAPKFDIQGVYGTSLQQNQELFNIGTEQGMQNN